MIILIDFDATWMKYCICKYLRTYVYSYPIIYKKAPGSSFPSNAACNYYISISASFWQQYVVSQGTDWIESSFGLIKGITFLLYREEKAFFFPLLRLLSGKEKSSFLAWSINVTYKVEFQSLVWFNISALPYHWQDKRTKDGWWALFCVYYSM